jgi:hypothetical protein
MRRRRREGLESGDLGDIEDGEGERDLELGVRRDDEGEFRHQETGIVPAHTAPATTDVTDELDHWDENMEDDGEDEEEYEAVGGKGSGKK